MKKERVSVVVAVVIAVACGVWALGDGTHSAVPSAAVPAGLSAASTVALKSIRVEPAKNNETRAPRQEEVAHSARARSFGGAKNLWDFARAAVQSNNPSDLLEGFASTNACVNYLSTAAELNKFATGEKSQVVGQLTSDRQLAITELNTRCAGFQQAGRELTQELRSTLSSRLSSAGYQFQSGHAISNEQLKSLLSSDAPDAVGTAAIHLLGPWQAKLGIADGDPRENELAVAVSLAQCDLGKDCSVGSWESLEECALTGRCNQDARSNWEQGFDAEQIARIGGYRQQVVAAVRNRDWAGLGLGN